jgi:glycerol-3-phosphate dehydrogenase (NAD(P)+)
LSTQHPVAIVGGGAWGTALAVNPGRRGIPVRLWMYEDELVRRMLARRDNPVYLPGVEIPDAVAPTDDIATAVTGASLVVFAVPTPFARALHGRLRPRIGRRIPVVVATKGIEEDTLLLPTEVAAAASAETPILRCRTLVRRGWRGATAIVIAAETRLARHPGPAFGGDAPPLSDADVVGVQIAAALKNVVAIAAGSPTLGFGHNTIAALITRGWPRSGASASRGGFPETFPVSRPGRPRADVRGGLSRNRQVGQAIGRGRLADVSRMPRRGRVRTALGATWPETPAFRCRSSRRSIESSTRTERHAKRCDAS